MHLKILDSSSNLSITKYEPFNSAEPFILKCNSNIFNGKVCVNGAIARFSSAEEYELVEFPIFSYDLSPHTRIDLNPMHYEINRHRGEVEVAYPTIRFEVILLDQDGNLHNRISTTW